MVCAECHKAKNLMAARGEPTATGLAVKQLQAELPDVSVVYLLQERSHRRHMVKCVMGF